MISMIITVLHDDNKTWHYVFCCWSGGGTATYSTHWLDTIKVKMQSFPQQHPSACKCLKFTLKEEGVRGLYRGATPAVLGQMCKTATVFMSYSLCEELVRKSTGKLNLTS